MTAVPGDESFEADDRVGRLAYGVYVAQVP